MAEILIQRKRRRSRWPWVLGLLVLALLPLLFLNNRDEESVATATTRRDTTVLRDTTVRPDTTRAPDTTAVRVSSAAAGSAGPSAPTELGAATPAASALAAPSGGAPRTDSAPTPSRSAPIVPTRIASTAPNRPAPTGANRTTATAAGTIAASTKSPASFRSFIATPRAPATERAHGEYAAAALERLATELRALGASQAGVLPIRAYADSLRLPNTWDGAQADFARAAFLGAVYQFEGLSARTRGRIDVPRLRAIAWQLDAKRPLLPQRATVDRFFAAARDALDSLSRRR